MEGIRVLYRYPRDHILLRMTVWLIILLSLIHTSSVIYFPHLPISVIVHCSNDAHSHLAERLLPLFTTTVSLASVTIKGWMCLYQNMGQSSPCFVSAPSTSYIKSQNSHSSRRCLCWITDFTSCFPVWWSQYVRLLFDHQNDSDWTAKPLTYQPQHSSFLPTDCTFFPTKMCQSPPYRYCSRCTTSPCRSWFL